MEKAHCALRTGQLAGNGAAGAAVLAAYAALAVATAGLSLYAQAATSAVPVPLSWAVPNAGKNIYYLGYLHERSMCNQTSGKDVSSHWGVVNRGRATVEDGCFVWSLLSYERANHIRITVFGGKTIRAVYEATGFLLTGLMAEDGELKLFIVAGKDTPAVKLPVHHQDQVQYVSCGEYPKQTKWHVTVVGGKATAAIIKHEGGTGTTGVEMPEKGPIMRAALVCHVWADGSSGNPLDPDDHPPKEEYTVHARTARLLRSVDPSRLNLFKNRLRARLVQPEDAVPYTSSALST